MSNEFDNFIKEIKALNKEVKNMEKAFSTMSKNASGAAKDFGGFGPMSSDSGNLLAQSFGLGINGISDPKKRSIRTAAFQAETEDERFFRAGNRSVRRAFSKNNMAEFRFSASDSDPLSESDIAFNKNLSNRQKDRNWNRSMGVYNPSLYGNESTTGFLNRVRNKMDEASTFGGAVAAKVMGAKGITRQEFAALPEGLQQSVSSVLPNANQILGLMSGVQNGVAGFLPDVGKSISRSTSYYNAVRAGGSQMSRNQGISNTFDTMNRIGGISSVGSDANVAEYLAQRGMTSANGENSTYQQTIRATANAAKYLNISNESAVASIEGMTSGVGSANMLKNFGIYTSDLKSGKEKTQGQIFEELAQRLTAGRRGASVEQTQASIRRGALGATINSFFQGDEAGAQMFKQYMVDRARPGGGVSMDLSNEGAMQSIYAGQADNNRNPLNAQMTLNANETESLGMAQDEYIKGMELATVAIGTLQKAAGAAANVMMGFPNALLQTLMGNKQVQGLVSGGKAIATYASQAQAGITEVALAAATSPFPAVAGALISGVTAAYAAGAMPTVMSLGGQMMVNLGSKGWSSGAGENAKRPGGNGDSSGAPSNPLAGVNVSGNVADTSGMATDGLTKSPNNYGFNDYSKESGKKHEAIDYAMSEGTAVRAVADGVVQKVDRKTTTNTRGKGGRKTTFSNSLGMYVRIYHAGGYVSVYGHLSAINVEEDQPVKKGDIIGLSGNTGNSTGPHLHLKIVKATGPKDYSEASPVDPNSVSVRQLVGNVVAAPAPSTESAYSTLLSDVKPSAGSFDASGVINSLMGLSSGDPKAILSAINSLGAGMGVKLNPNATYANTYGISGLSASTGASTAAAAVGKASSGTAPNVTINLSIPNTSPTEAEKFARLVKQLLEDNTLRTNTAQR